jgi:hypothetical protein
VTSLRHLTPDTKLSVSKIPSSIGFPQFGQFIQRQSVLQNIYSDHCPGLQYDLGFAQMGQMLPKIAMVESQCLYRAQPDTYPVKLIV